MTGREREIKRQNDYLGVTEWNERGITGKGINTLNCEGMSTHGQITRQSILDVAPGTNIINASIGEKQKSGVTYDIGIWYQDKNWDFFKFMQSFNIKTLTSSNHGDNNTGTWESGYLNEAKKAFNLIFFNLAGNVGDAPNGSFPHDVAMYVAACYFDKRGIPIAVPQFCKGKEIDFTTFMGNDRGTSFSSPRLCGMANLILERYGDMSHEEMQFFLEMISKDIEDDGKDFKSGYGIPVLPRWDKKYITMQKGRAEYKSNGIKKLMDVSAEQKDYRLFVPIRFISEELGSKVEWYEESKKVTIRKDDIYIELTIGSIMYRVNGIDKKMDVSPYQKNYRAYVPIRFIAEELGCKVRWIEAEQKALILEE